MRKPLLLLVTLAACGGAENTAKQPDPQPTASTTTAPHPVQTAQAAQSACLPSAVAKGEIVDVVMKGSHALVCYGEGENSETGTCADIDLASSTLAKTESWKRPADAKQNDASEAFVVTTTADAAKVCKASAPKDCATVKLQMKKVGEKKDVTAAANSDGTRLFVLAPERKAGGDPKLTTSWTTYGDTYDVKTGKRIFHQRLTTTSNPIFSDMTNHWTASFAGKNLVVGDTVCCGPGGTTMLIDPEKGTVKRLHGYAGSDESVGGSIHAVLDEKKLTFVDFDTMQDVGAPLVAPGKPLDSPESTSARVASGGGKIVFAFANPAGVWILDAATRAKSAELVLPVCP